MRRPAIALLLALILPLAGCGGVGPGHGTASFAPGVTDERVVDGAALADAHRTVLNGTSYEYVSNYSQRVDAEGYHYAVDHDTRVLVAADGSFRYRHHGVVTGSERSSNYRDGVWANRTVAVMRVVNVANGTVTYTRYRPPEPFTAANATRMQVSRPLDDAAVARTWNRSDGEYARLRANETETRRMVAENGTAVNATTVRNVTATVRSDGLVRSLDSSVRGLRPLPVAAGGASDDGRPLARIRDTGHTRYSGLGTTTVPRPAWVDDALAATRGLPLGRSTDPRPANRTTQ